jgi:hypothetical protein
VNSIFSWLNPQTGYHPISTGRRGQGQDAPIPGCLSPPSRPSTCSYRLISLLALSAARASLRRRVVKSSQSGFPPEFIRRSLARTLSSAQISSASDCFLHANATAGRRSTSIVKIESESPSLISVSPSAPVLQAGVNRCTAFNPGTSGSGPAAGSSSPCGT